jgi:hypothetical protein
MSSSLRPALLLGAVLLSAACAAPSVTPSPAPPTDPPATTPAPPPPTPEPLTPSPEARLRLSFDLRSGDHGWRADYSDYTKPVAPGLDFRAERDERGFLLSGKNVSDDLFMYLRRQLTAADGISGGTAYRLTYRFKVLSDGPSGCMGVGGAPGEGVTFKVGGSATEPLPVERDDEIVLSIDKGNQVTGGRDASAAGDIANGIECDDAVGQDPMPFGQIVREHTHDHEVTAADDGTLWLVVGTDSGFEGTSNIVWQSIEVELEPVA